MMADPTLEKLALQQSIMADQIERMSRSVEKMTEVLSGFAVLEQKHLDAMGAIKRAHSRQDELEKDYKDDVKDIEKRLQALELTIARNQWIERAVSVVLFGAVAMWAQGGLGQ